MERGKKRLELLALSDTHLGEETSLLSFPRGLQHVWEVLYESPDFWEPVFGDGCGPGGGEVEVGTLVLVGDVVDRTLSSTSQISASGHAFSMMIGHALKVERVVYVPGNHDHTLWTDLAANLDNSPKVTKPEGLTIARKGTRPHRSAEELLSILLGYPNGWAWWWIENNRREDFELLVTNPVYAGEVAGTTYAFAHGTHFRPEVAPSRTRDLLRLFDRSRLDRPVMDVDFAAVQRDLREAETIEDLEEIVTPFVDSFWPSSKNEPTSRSDELWYLMTLLGAEGEAKRGLYPSSRAFGRDDLEHTDPDRVQRLTNPDGTAADSSLERFTDYFAQPLRAHVRAANLDPDRLVFVYGDTHRGGFGDLSLSPRGNGGNGQKMRVYNCGSWVVSPEKTHPACHLFAVDGEGREFVLDLSFEGVEVGGEFLLNLAADDVEHRQKAAGGLARLAGAGLRLFQGR